MFSLKSNNRLMIRLAATTALAVLAGMPVHGAEPVVKTVRWVASDPSIPHDTFAYRSITLKGTSSIAGQNIRATWDFGDNTDPASFTVVNGYDVSARHIYYATPGAMFTARLTVVDTETGESGSATYLVAMKEKTLETEVNVAIDEGLWYLHKSMQQDSTNASNLLAFERNGHLESGDSANPYTETVALGLKTLRQVKSPTPDIVAALAAATNQKNPHATATSLPATTVSQPTTTVSQPSRDRQGAVADISDLLNLLQLTDRAAQLPDWYSAEVTKGDPADGIARTLVNRQQDDGSWTGHSTDPALETSASVRVLAASPSVNVLSSSVTNVTSQVLVTTSGIIRSGPNYKNTVYVKNTSGSTVTGPLSLGLPNLTSGASLLNSSGTFNNDPYINLPAGDLNAGSTTSVVLTFTKPANNPIVFNYTPTVYSGTMPPSALTVTCPANTATTGTPYNSAYTGSGGVLAYTFSTPAGMLPHNLTLDPVTGAVTGTPDMVQNPTFTAKVTDSAGGTPETASDATCHINVTSANQPPTAVAQSTSTNEDIAKLITLTGTDPDGNALTFTIVTPPSNGMLGMLGSPNCVGNPSTCTASVTYTPNANTSGSDSFTFKVNDGMVDSSPATVSITINFVNDVPSFTKGADQSANKGASAQTVVGWATNISPGPGSNEAGQMVNFVITGNTTPGIFSVAPAVSPTGTLTFTPSASTTGTSTITLVIHDDGGMANGGVDTSAPQSFTITTNDPPKITSANSTTFQPGKTGQSFTVTTTGFPTGASMMIGETGTLPSGVMFHDNGDGTATINGTPASGTQGSSPYALTLSANNGVPPPDSQNFTLNITCPAIAVSGLTPLNLVFNVNSTTTLTLAQRTYSQMNGNGTIVWTAPGLPTNVTIDGSTGVVSGAPNVTGTFSATITATDAGGCVGTKAVTVAVKPVATNDMYTGLVDNTQFVVTGGATTTPGTPTVITNGMATFRLTNNDLPSGNVTLTSTGTFATAAGGSVTIAADGTFIYTPKANPTLAAITADSFTYTISSDTGGTGTPTTAQGTANLTLAGRVWYVLNNVGMTGNGQSQNPFKSLAEAIAASTANDFIFVYQGDGTTANLSTAVLKTGQSLIGQGVALVVNGSTLVAAGGTPLIGGTVTLNTNTTARGFNLSTGGNTGMNDPGGAITGVTVNTVGVTTTTGTGVNLSDIAGTLSFTGLTTNGGAGATLTGSNSSATFTFSGVSVSSGANTAFNATGGGTVTVTGSGNTLTSTTGTALNIANTTIGAAGMTFQSISSNGALIPISLSSTSGNLTVTGDGTGHANGSGGTLANSGLGGTNTLGQGPIFALTATGTITLKSMNISLNTAAFNGALFDNNAGGTLAVNITGCTFTGVSGSVNQNKGLLQFEGGGASNVTANVQNSFFFNNRTYGFVATAAGTSIMNATLNQSGFGTDVNTGAPVNQPGTTITNAPPFSVLISNGSAAQVHYNITNNTFWGARVADGALYAVTISGASTTGSLNGFFTGNKIGKTGTVGSGCLGNCAGLGLLPGTGGTFNATVGNNDIRQVGSFGINFVNTTTGSNVDMIGHFTNNTLAENDNTSGAPAAAMQAIHVAPGNSGGAAVNSCAEITGNNISGNWQSVAFIRISTSNTTGTLVLPGLSPTTGASTAQIDAFVAGNNTLTGGSVSSTIGGPINGGAACTVTP